MKTFSLLKNGSFLTVASLLSINAALGQTILVSDDFDGNTTGPARMVTFNDTAAEVGDYFRITDGSDISTSYTNATGSYFAAQDIDGITGITDSMLGGQGASRQQLRYDNISIIGFSTLTLSLSAAQQGNGWDLPDLMHATVVFDGVTPMDGDTGYATWFDSIPDGDAFNAPAGLDLAYDGDGDAAFAVTQAFSAFSDTSIPVPAGAGSTASLVFTFDLNSGNEDFGLDDIVLTGVVPEPSSVLLGALGLFGFLFQRRRG